jgi:hypothetical protein
MSLYAICSIKRQCTLINHFVFDVKHKLLVMIRELLRNEKIPKEDTIGVVFLQLKHNFYGIMICVHPILFNYLYSMSHKIYIRFIFSFFSCFYFLIFVLTNYIFFILLFNFTDLTLHDNGFCFLTSWVLLLHFF